MHFRDQVGAEGIHCDHRRRPPSPSRGELLVGVVDDACRELAGEYRVQKFFGEYRSDTEVDIREGSGIGA